jgi:pilus assembly protein FimV
LATPVLQESIPPVDQETLDEAFFEIKAPAAAEDETSESSKPGAPADSITGDDVAKRLEGMFQKKDEPVTFEPPPTAAESTGTATEAIDDTALSSDSVIETVGILTGNDVEDRLNDMFKEAESVKDRAEQPPASLEKRQSIEKEEAFEPVAETIEEFEETLVSGDNEPLVPGAATKETVPASPVDRAEAVDDESSALGELEEILDAHPLESLETETAKTHPETIETGGEQTAVFEDFTPGSVPKAPPPAPDVPIFLTSKDTPMDSETILAEVGKNDSPYDLPDHVLTPTLADLYFQQGQPHLALSIYRRLLEKSGGENDKFKKRIGEIEKAVADGTALNRFPEEQAAVPVVKPKKITPAVPRATSHTKKSFGVSGEKLRPLSGVRLKKRPKIQWRKKAGEK